uniref:DUF4939 domain-containing protein n=1 Tax=Crocodylus porosus TaxID=8502 RepID=A0A7M4EZQ0_CROPO
QRSLHILTALQVQCTLFLGLLVWLAHLSHPGVCYLPSLMGIPAASGGLLTSVISCFASAPKTYPSDTAKVGLILSLLSGEALAWASTLLESADFLLDMLEDFIKAMVKIFGGLTGEHIWDREERGLEELRRAAQQGKTVAQKCP